VIAVIPAPRLIIENENAAIASGDSLTLREGARLPRLHSIAAKIISQFVHYGVF
jgi:hypothetical protein